MNAGDSLYVDDPGLSYDSHLWFIISDPDIDSENILIVNFTGLRSDKDPSCIVHPGEHPYVVKDTCVNYPESKVKSLAELQKLVSLGLVRHHAPADEALLKRIRQGAMDSQLMKFAHAEILINQNLVD